MCTWFPLGDSRCRVRVPIYYTHTHKAWDIGATFKKSCRILSSSLSLVMHLIASRRFALQTDNEYMYMQTENEYMYRMNTCIHTCRAVHLGTTFNKISSILALALSLPIILWLTALDAQTLQRLALSFSSSRCRVSALSAPNASR